MQCTSWLDAQSRKGRGDRLNKVERHKPWIAYLLVLLATVFFGNHTVLAGDLEVAHKLAPLQTVPGTNIFHYLDLSVPKNARLLESAAALAEGAPDNVAYVLFHGVPHMNDDVRTALYGLAAQKRIHVADTIMMLSCSGAKSTWNQDAFGLGRSRSPSAAEFFARRVFAEGGRRPLVIGANGALVMDRSGLRVVPTLMTEKAIRGEFPASELLNHAVDDRFAFTGFRAYDDNGKRATRSMRIGSADLPLSTNRASPVSGPLDQVVSGSRGAADVPCRRGGMGRLARWGGRLLGPVSSLAEGGKILAAAYEEFGTESHNHGAVMDAVWKTFSLDLLVALPPAGDGLRLVMPRQEYVVPPDAQRIADIACSPVTKRAVGAINNNCVLTEAGRIQAIRDLYRTGQPPSWVP